MALSLTFDDGRASQVTDGVPVLDSFGVKVTFYAQPENLLEELEQFSVGLDHTLVELAFAWLLYNQQVSSVIAGASTPEQLDANAKAAELHLTAEEMEKLRRASNRDVYDDSKATTLPIAGAIVEAYIQADAKMPWYIDLLNINLDNFDLASAQQRIQMYLDAFASDGTRITENLDFD